MIVVDTSALVAIAFDEPECNAFVSAIRRSESALICTVTAVEARVVVHGRRGQRAVMLLDDVLALEPVELVAAGADIAAAAYAAFVTYGKGNRHPAGLNFGDLFSYALAKVRGLPLLFKGDDFGHTDIARALAQPGTAPRR